MRQFKYIGNITPEELETQIVFPCFDEDGYRCILIKNAFEKTVVSKYETDNMVIKLNAKLLFESKEYFFHIITSKNTDFDAVKSFDLIYEYIFTKIDTAVSDDTLAMVILSLEEYFRITPEKDNKKLQIGVWGELFCVDYLYNLGFTNIVKKYHNNFYFKHDIELSDSLRMEVKTTVDSKRIHHFRHDQICRNDVTVIVSSIILEESQQGTTLLEMCRRIMSLMDDPDERLNMNKIIRMCDLSDEKPGMTFSETKATEDIRFYFAESLPMITSPIPNGVTRVAYDVDCSFGEAIEPIKLPI